MTWEMIEQPFILWTGLSGETFDNHLGGREVKLEQPEIQTF